MKAEFTVLETAKICKVSPRLVSRWLDSGRLQGYQLPDMQVWRVPRHALVAFLKEHGMALGDLEAVEKEAEKKEVAASECVSTCGSGAWWVAIYRDGECRITDNDNKEMHYSPNHRSTAMHLSSAMQLRAKLRKRLSQKIEAYNEQAKPWLEGSPEQQRRLEEKNAAAYVAWRISKELLELLELT